MEIINPNIAKVSHLENEIDETFGKLEITHKKLDREETSTITISLTKKFLNQ